MHQDPNDWTTWPTVNAPRCCCVAGCSNFPYGDALAWLIEQAKVCWEAKDQAGSEAIARAVLLEIAAEAQQRKPVDPELKAAVEAGFARLCETDRKQCVDPNCRRVVAMAVIVCPGCRGLVFEFLWRPEMPVTRKRKAESGKPESQRPGEPEGVSPRSAKVKSLPNGQKSWECVSCDIHLPWCEPVCPECCAEVRPDLLGQEKLLAELLGGDQEFQLAFERLRASGATDYTLGSQLAEMLSLRAARSDEPAGAPWFRGRSGAVCCWLTSVGGSGGLKTTYDISVWLGESERPQSLPDLKTPDLVAFARRTWDIPSPPEAQRRAAGKRATWDPPPAESGNAETAEAAEGKRKAESGKPKESRKEPVKKTAAVAKISSPPLSPSPPLPLETPAAEQSIDVTLIDVPKGKNPRKEFDQAELQKLADSLQAHGQLQNIIVRQVGQRFELIAGERRLRAAKLARLTGLRCRVLPEETTDAEVIELRGFENFSRKDFNAIEEAIWFQQMLDEAGYSQGTLAKRLGITQGQVSNRVRLLALPAEWQARVISGEITATAARAIAPWANRPAVLQSLDTEVRENPGYFNAETDECVADAVHRAAMPLQGWTNRHGHVHLKPTEAQRADLDVVKFDDREYAFNVEAWEQLATAGATKHQAKEDRRPKTAASPALSPAEQKRKAEQLKAQYAKRIYRYRTGWLQQRVIARFGQLTEPQAVKWMLWFLVQDVHARNKALAAAIAQHGGKKGIKTDYEAPQWFAAALGELPADKALPVLRDALKAWLSESFEGFRAIVRPRVIEGVAADLGVDLIKEWRVDETFLLLHSADQILTLCGEWKISKSPKAAAAKRKDLVTEILRIDAEAAESKKLPAPKCLTKAKEVSLT